jgi:hypothetical protein
MIQAWRDADREQRVLVCLSFVLMLCLALTLLSVAVVFTA